MQFFQYKMSSCMDSDMKNKKKKSLKKLKQETLNFLLFSDVKHSQLSEHFRNPSYEDLMSAILSMYVDLIMVSLSNKEEVDRLEETKRLNSHVTYLLRHKPVYILDVLLQQTVATETDSDVILPLLKRCISVVNNVDHVTYTKIMLTVYQMKKICAEKMEPLVLRVRQVAAPKRYLKWLREKDAAILDELPETKHFKGTHITQFLLDEAKDDLTEKLLDLLTDTSVVEQNESDMRETEDICAEAEVQNVTSAAGDVYFVDTSGEQDVCRDLTEEADENEADETTDDSDNNRLTIDLSRGSDLSEPEDDDERVIDKSSVHQILKHTPTRNMRETSKSFINAGSTEKHNSTEQPMRTPLKHVADDVGDTDASEVIPLCSGRHLQNNSLLENLEIVDESFTSVDIDESRPFPNIAQHLENLRETVQEGTMSDTGSPLIPVITSGQPDVSPARGSFDIPGRQHCVVFNKSPQDKTTSEASTCDDVSSDTSASAEIRTVLRKRKSTAMIFDSTPKRLSKTTDEISRQTSGQILKSPRSPVRYSSATTNLSSRSPLKEATPRSPLKEATPRSPLKEATPRSPLKEATMKRLASDRFVVVEGKDYLERTNRVLTDVISAETCYNTRSRSTPKVTSDQTEVSQRSLRSRTLSVNSACSDIFIDLTQSDDPNNPKGLSEESFKPQIGRKRIRSSDKDSVFPPALVSYSGEKNRRMTPIKRACAVCVTPKKDDSSSVNARLTTRLSNSSRKTLKDLSKSPARAKPSPAKLAETSSESLRKLSGRLSLSSRKPAASPKLSTQKPDGSSKLSPQKPAGSRIFSPRKLFDSSCRSTQQKSDSTKRLDLPGSPKSGIGKNLNGKLSDTQKESGEMLHSPRKSPTKRSSTVGEPHSKLSRTPTDHVQHEQRSCTQLTLETRSARPSTSKTTDGTPARPSSPQPSTSKASMSSYSPKSSPSKSAKKSAATLKRTPSRKAAQQSCKPGFYLGLTDR